MLKNKLLDLQTTESADASFVTGDFGASAATTANTRVDDAVASGSEQPQPRLLRAKQFIKENEKKISQTEDRKEDQKQQVDEEEEELDSREKRLYIQCHICNKKIKRKYHFRRHLKTHRNEKEHQCPICHYKSVRKDNLKSHMRTHQKHIDLVTNYQKEAGKLFLTGEDACFSVSDKQKHSGGEEEKGANLSDPESIIPLLLSSEDFVKKCFKTWYGSLHQVQQEKSSAATDETKLCGSESQKRSLESLDQIYKRQKIAEELDNKLRNILSSSQQQECDTENSSSTSKHLQHLTDVKIKKGEQAMKPKFFKERTCRLCDYKTFDHKEFQEHVNAEHKEGTFYKCNECGYKGKNVSKMVEHIRTHTGERPFKCDQCNYAAKRKDNLAQHKTVRHDKYKTTDPIFSHFMNGASAFTPVHTKQPRFGPHASAEPLPYMVDSRYHAGGFPSMLLRPNQLVANFNNVAAFHDPSNPPFPIHYGNQYGN